MGIDWMSGARLSQAIPPAYTEFLGREMLKALEHRINLPLKPLQQHKNK